MKKTNPGKKAQSETEKILGRPPAAQAEAEAAKGRPKWQKYYRQLRQIREYLLTQHERMEAGAADYDPKDLMQADADSATDEADRDFAFGMASNYQKILDEVEWALRRIEEGAYGKCELTGRTIPADRLKAVPWTRFAAEAEKQLEKEGRVPMATALPRPESRFEARSESHPASRATPEKEPAGATNSGETKEE